MERGGLFEYTSWCDQCQKVRPHLHGDCLVCRPIGYPRPAVVLPEVEA